MRPVRGVVALLLRFVRGLRLASPSLLANFLFRVQISRVLRRSRLSCCAIVPMFLGSAPLGSQRSCASVSGSSGSAAAPRSGSALDPRRFACNLMSSFPFCFPNNAVASISVRLERFWARLPKRGVCEIPGLNVELLLVLVVRLLFHVRSRFSFAFCFVAV